MEPYDEYAASTYKLGSNDDWLRCCQNLALPTLPPTTPEARQYFFSRIQEFTTLANVSGKGRVDYASFAKEWNRSADGKTCFYITTKVLSAYAKTWEKVNNIQASKELIASGMESIHQSRDIFAAPQSAFPTYLTGSSAAIHPHQGVLGLDQASLIPPSLNTEMSLSHPSLPQPQSEKPFQVGTSTGALIGSSGDLLHPSDGTGFDEHNNSDHAR